jgi:hypothetical protein
MNFSSLHGLLGLALASCLSPLPARAGNPDEAENQAIAALKKVGGHISRDENQAGKPVVYIFLSGDRVQDDVLRHLRAFPQVRKVHLNATKVTDAGLVHLRGLMQLRTLWFLREPITDAGLEHLKGLTHLDELWLDGTKVTDAGLACLRDSANCAP